MKRLLLVLLMALGAGGAQATLVGRDINGNAVIQRDSNGVLDSSAVFLYDTVLNITWLRLARYNGSQSWGGATTWAANLTVGNYSGWRLPTMIDTGPAGCDFSNGGSDCGWNVQTTSDGIVYSELASLFHDTLGNKSYRDTSGNGQPWGLVNTGDFQYFESGGYWSGLEVASDTTQAWYFRTNYGEQSVTGKTFLSLYALPVRDGDVLATPIPAAAWLMLSGIGALGAAARRRKTLEVQP